MAESTGSPTNPHTTPPASKGRGISPHTRFGMGAALTRTEDFKFLTGRGSYTDDVREQGTLHAYILRSPYAHASFSIESTSEAKDSPGVHGVFTALDFADLKDLPCVNFITQADGSPPAFRDIPPLCQSTVHHVGDAVAMVVADDLQKARDAAELIEIDYESLDAVVDTGNALDEGAAKVAEHSESNLAYRHFIGEREATAAIMEAAAHVVEITVTNNRLIANYMEPRACHASWDSQAGTYTVTLGSQGVSRMRDWLSELTGTDKDKIRVITGDVGGGFGTKVFVYREYPLVMSASRKLGRPVRWNADRSEHFVQDAHGRDNVTTAKMALDENGKFLAIEVDVIAAMGAYLHAYAPFIPFLGVTMATGLYDIPVMACTTHGVYTNTVPTDAYRGAGRPEAAYLIERLVDQCSQELDIPVDEIRRRNFIRPDQLPYTTPAGRTYDTGEFEAHMDVCMKRADWNGFEVRRETAREQGKLLGIGMATYVEACAFAGSEPAFLTLNDDGRVLLRIGTQSNGQGHAAILASGGGTGGSRSVPLGGTSTVRAAKSLSANIKLVAARELGCDVEEILLEEGVARVESSNALITLADIAAAATEEERNASGVFEQDEATYPNGTHICEIEIDLDTATTRLLAYNIVDDFGATVNPILLEGQVQGGVVQSIGQCLLEHTVYDEDGQLLSGSLMDYALPRADNLPNIHFETRNVPSTTNELGMKGAGEAGTIGACPAVMNAVSDALFREFGDGRIDMPVTPMSMFDTLSRLRAAS